MSRIRSQHGNVISADFRPAIADLSVTIENETLYADGMVVLIRTTASFAGRAVEVVHTLGDLATGRIVQLNSKDAQP